MLEKRTKWISPHREKLFLPSLIETPWNANVRSECGPGSHRDGGNTLWSPQTPFCHKTTEICSVKNIWDPSERRTFEQRITKEQGNITSDLPHTWNSAVCRNLIDPNLRSTPQNINITDTLHSVVILACTIIIMHNYNFLREEFTQKSYQKIYIFAIVLQKKKCSDVLASTQKLSSDNSVNSLASI